MHTALWRRRGALGNGLGQGGWESRFQSNIWLSRQELSCKNPLKSIDEYNDCKYRKSGSQSSCCRSGMEPIVSAWLMPC